MRQRIVTMDLKALVIERDNVAHDLEQTESRARYARSDGAPHAIQMTAAVLEADAAELRQRLSELEGELAPLIRESEQYAADQRRERDRRQQQADHRAAELAALEQALGLPRLRLEADRANLKVAIASYDFFERSNTWAVSPYARPNRQQMIERLAAIETALAELIGNGKGKAS